MIATPRYLGRGSWLGRRDPRVPLLVGVLTAATVIQIWDIRIETADGGILVLSQGGARLSIDGAPTLAAEDREYRNLYARFARLIAEGRSDVDLAPLTHVADAFLLGRRIEVEAFHDAG